MVDQLPKELQESVKPYLEGLFLMYLRAADRMGVTDLAMLFDPETKKVSVMERQDVVEQLKTSGIDMGDIGMLSRQAIQEKDQLGGWVILQHGESVYVFPYLRPVLSGLGLA